MVVNIGIDEVGCGALFGPLVVAACADTTGWRNEQVADSKTIRSERRRNKLAVEICQNMAWSLVAIPNTYLEHVGVRAALKDAYAKVIEQLAQRLVVGPDVQFSITLDGDLFDVVSFLKGRMGYAIRCMPKADAKIFEVSAASIVAKDSRDRWCHEIVGAYPTLGLYGIAENKGYTSKIHDAALIQHGPTEWHRKTFVETRLRNLGAKGNEQNTVTAAAPIEPAGQPPQDVAVGDAGPD